MQSVLELPAVLLFGILFNFARSQDDYCYSFDQDPSFRHSLYASYFPLENPDDDPIEFESKKLSKQNMAYNLGNTFTYYMCL